MNYGDLAFGMMFGAILGASLWEALRPKPEKELREHLADSDIELNYLYQRLERANAENNTREQIEYQQKMLSLHSADLDRTKERVLALEKIHTRK